MVGTQATASGIRRRTAFSVLTAMAVVSLLAISVGVAAAASVPGAPTIGTATGGNAQATVSWTAPASDGGSPITGYVVTPFVGFFAQPATTFPSTATTQTVVGLTNGTTYKFRVAAINALGTGAQSTSSNAVTPAATAPGAPTIGVATGGNANASVSWTAPASDGGAPITGYVVTPYIGASPQSAVTFASVLTTQTVPGLTNGSTYTFKVAATNAVGTGAPSAASNAVTPVTLPSAPTIGGASGGNAQATVSWTAPASDGGSPVTGYEVTPFIGAVAQAVVPFASTTTTQTLTGLTNGTGYTFRVAATTAIGTGPQSADSNLVTPAPTPPGAPAITAAAAGSAQVTLSWTAPASDGGSPVTGYEVTPFIGAAAQAVVPFASTATTQAVTGLTNGVTYTLKVAATNALGTGPLSVASAPVTPATVPTAPTIGTAIAQAGQAVVSWSAPASNGGSPVTGYVVTPLIGFFAQPSTTFPSTATTQTVTGLTNGTSYKFRVAAVNVVGTGPQSTSSNAVTPAITVPTAPVIGSATRGNHEVTVSWSAPSYDGGSPVTSYVVTPYIGFAAQPSTTFASPATTQTVTGLTNGTAYVFRVAAINAIGPGPQSASSNAATPASVPDAPSIGSATAGIGSVTLSWTAPASNGGSPVTGYQVTPYISSIAQASVVFGSTATTQLISGLVNGVSYRFRVAALNAVGTGAFSGYSNSATPIQTVPGAPTIGPATGGNAQAGLSWTAPASDGGSPITGYEVTPYIGASAQPPVTFGSPATSQTLTGLANATTYTFTVAAINAVGIGAPSAASNAATTLGMPGAPTIGSATGGNTQATVTWTVPVSNGGSPVTGYVVTPFIGLVPLPPTTFLSTATTQTVTGLTNGTAYRFKVAAMNIVGTGPMSAVTNLVTPAAQVPGAPTIGTVTGGDAEATVSWTPPGSDGGSPVTGYVLTPYANSVAQTPIVYPTAATTHTVTGLTNGTSYRFAVAAVNALGTGASSALSNAVTPATVPSAPTIGTATAGAASAIVTWTAPTSSGGASITGYVVTPYIGATPQTAVSFSSTATSQTLSGLTNGTTYAFRVAALNSAGTGPQSGASNAVTPLAVPGTPTIGLAVRGNMQATLSWTAPLVDGGSPITAYVITPYIGTTALAPVTFNSTATTQTITGLTNGTTYQFKVAAINVIGSGPRSTKSNAVIPGPAVPTAPTIGTVISGNAQVTLSWTAPASDGGAPVTGYEVTPYVAAVPQTPVVFTSTATTQSITGLTNGVSYTFKVAALNSAGTSPQSAASAAVTPATLPGAPTIGTVTGGNGQATVSWTAPASDGGAAITGYTVTAYVGFAPVLTTPFASTATTQTVAGLTNGTGYRFRVQAVNGVGTGPVSAVSSLVTPAPIVPDAPTIGGVVAGDGEVSVSWTAPGSDGGSPVTGYVVTPYIASVAQAAVPFASTATTQVITGLVNGTTYTFTVAATNAVGTGAASAESAPATPVAPPTVPDAPTIGGVVAGDGEVSVSWTAPGSDGGSPVTGYVVTPYIASVAQAAVPFASTATTQVITGLVNGTTYTFTVAATNAVGTGAASAESAPATPVAPPTVPDAPAAPSVLSVGDGEATLDWGSAPFDGGSAITSYRVTIYVGMVEVDQQTFASTLTVQTLTGLANGTTYTATVAAINAVGTSGESLVSPDFMPFV